MSTQTHTKKASASQNREFESADEANVPPNWINPYQPPAHKPELPQHSPLPWQLSNDGIIHNGETRIAKMLWIKGWESDDEADAAHIIRSVNSAEALAEEAEDTLRQFRLYLDDEDCELPDLSGLESALNKWKESK